MQENYEITPCFVYLRRMDDNLINIYLKKYGLNVRVASGDFERGKKFKESLPLWSGMISKEKKSRKRKRKDRDDLSSKNRQKYLTNEKTEDSCPPRKYFSDNGTHKVNFKMKKTSRLEHEKCSPCKFNQRKKNYLKMDSSIVKILKEKKRSERKKIREKNKCSRQISQSKINNMMKELKKLSETSPEETASSDVFTHFPEQRLRNVRKTFPTIHMCKNKSDDNNNTVILVNGGKQLKGVDEECSQFEQKTVGKVSQIENNDELCTFGGRYGSRICDSHLNSYVEKEALTTNNLCLDEDEYDSRGEDSEDDKQTVIFDEKFDTIGKVKENSEKVSECKQQNVKRNIKGGKLKSPRMLKQRKLSLVRIIKKGKMILRKSLGKPTRKIGRKVTERRHIERSKETIMRGNKFVEKFEDILAEVSNLVKHLHDTHKIIVHLKKDMEGNDKLAEHFKTVIEAQQENYRKEIWRNQETIMKGYDKMMSFCKKSCTISLEISKRTFLSIEDVENVLSRCILVENALEMLKSTQKMSALEKDEGKKETEDRGMEACLEKQPSIETVASSDNSSETIEKEPHKQIMSLDVCQDQLVPEKRLRISNNLYPDDSVTSSAKHLAFSSLASSVPCSISTHVLKERQVMPPRRGTLEHSEDLVLHESQSYESDRHLIPYQSSQKSKVNFINLDRNRDYQRNSFAMAGFPPAGRRSDFIQHSKPRVEHIQPGNNVQNQLLIGQMRHCLHQQPLTKNFFQFPTSGSVQQILTTKRPPRPQNPIPRVFEPEVKMNSKGDKQQCHQQPGLMHRPSVQRRINIDSNFAVPFNPITRGSFNQSKSSYLPYLMKSNPSTFGQYTSIRGICRPLSSRNNMTMASHSMPQKVISSHLLQSNTTIPNTSNTSFMSTPSSVRTPTSSIPVLLRQLQNPPSFSQNTNRCGITGEDEPGLGVSNPIQNIPSSMRAVHPVAQPSGSLSLAVAEQPLYVSKGNKRVLQALRGNKSSVSCGSCIVPISSTVQKSKNEPQVLDPTIPQKLTMKNHRLQAGAILKSSAVANKSKFQPDEYHVNRVIKVESIDLEGQEKLPETQKIDQRNSSRQYECAQNGCRNSGIRICKGCESVIYCSGTCQLNHWKQKHKEECAKLKELRR